MHLVATTAALFMIAGTALAQGTGMIVSPAEGSVDETVERLERAIESAGATVFAVVDHSKGAASADMELEPTTLVIFGNPQVGTPIMQSDPLAGLDLPMRVLVFERDGETQIAYHDPQSMQQRYDLDSADESIAKMSAALEKLTGAASADR